MRCDEVDLGGREVNARPRLAGLSCAGCGCTDDAACPGGCYWVSMDPPLCSACENAAEDLAGEADPRSGLFGVQVCPASSPPAAHALLFVDETSGYCARCREGFCL